MLVRSTGQPPSRDGRLGWNPGSNSAEEDALDAGEPVPVTDPAVIEAIDDWFTLSVFEAGLLAERQRRGGLRPPRALQPREQALVRLARARLAAR